MTLMQGHIGSRQRKKVNLELFRQLSKQVDLDFANVYMAWPSYYFVFFNLFCWSVVIVVCQLEAWRQKSQYGLPVILKDATWRIIHYIKRCNHTHRLRCSKDSVIRVRRGVTFDFGCSLLAVVFTLTNGSSQCVHGISPTLLTTGIPGRGRLEWLT